MRTMSDVISRMFKNNTFNTTWFYDSLFLKAFFLAALHQNRISLERGVSASSSGLNLSWYTDSTQLGTPAVLKHSVPHQQTTLQHKLSQYCIKQPQLDLHHWPLGQAPPHPDTGRTIRWQRSQYKGHTWGHSEGQPSSTCCMGWLV